MEEGIKNSLIEKHSINDIGVIFCLLFQWLKKKILISPILL